MSPTVRKSAPNLAVNDGLGPLQNLPGRWVGRGFNLISRPDFHDNKTFFLQLNATQESLVFTQIGAPIPNRGSLQDDIFFLGCHYFQEISDAVTLDGLHIEPGIWLTLPATQEPQAPATVCRLATVPHGDAVLAQGTSFTVEGGPQIAVENSTPLDATTGQPITNAAYLAPFTSTPLPSGVPAGAIADPNVVLTAAIAHQKIVETTVLVVDTTANVGGSTGGIENIPFVVQNANATEMRATFWIEKVENPDGSTFMQLQYTQRVMLRFDNIDWPHISVGTLAAH